MEIVNAIYEGLPTWKLAINVAAALLGTMLGAVEVICYAPSNATLRVLLGQSCTMANVVTLGRGLCGLLIIEAARRNVAMAMFFWSAVGAASDLADGPLARWRRAETELGEKLDQYIDWWFGFCVIGAVAYWDGPVLLNGWGTLAVTLATYLFWRAKYPNLTTTTAAKVKTAMQFVGGPTILCGIAFEAECVYLAGYILMWASVPVMFCVYLEYKHMARSSP